MENAAINAVKTNQASYSNLTEIDDQAPEENRFRSPQPKRTHL